MTTTTLNTATMLLDHPRQAEPLPIGSVFLLYQQPVVITHQQQATASLLFEPMLQRALSRSPTTPAKAIIDRARRVLFAAQELSRTPDRVAVSRSGALAITFQQSRRYAIFECDEDGDVVLTLTDRNVDAEAQTDIVKLGQEQAYIAKAVRFVRG